APAEEGVHAAIRALDAKRAARVLRKPARCRRSGRARPVRHRSPGEHVDVVSARWHRRDLVAPVDPGDAGDVAGAQQGQDPESSKPELKLEFTNRAPESIQAR